MANSIGTEQTAIWSAPALFVYGILSDTLGNFKTFTIYGYPCYLELCNCATYIFFFLHKNAFFFLIVCGGFMAQLTQWGHGHTFTGQA